MSDVSWCALEYWFSFFYMQFALYQLHPEKDYCAWLAVFVVFDHILHVGIYTGWTDVLIKFSFFTCKSFTYSKYKRGRCQLGKCQSFCYLSLHCSASVCVCVCVCKRGREILQTRKNKVLRKNSVKCSHTLDHLVRDGVGFPAAIVLRFVTTTDVQLTEIRGKQDGSLLSYFHHHL